MKVLKFTTIAGRTFKVRFKEFQFFDYFTHCGIPNLKIENQVFLFLNNLHESLFDVPYDSVQSIEYEFSEEFRKRYRYINDTLIYNV